jgi:TadE-like protein
MKVPSFFANIAHTAAARDRASRPVQASQSWKRARRRGATTIEMTLVGIPLIFTLISIFEISRGMWNYQTLAYAAKEGVRFASVHGINCVSNNNNCPVTIGQVASYVQKAGVGLDPSTTKLIFLSSASSDSSGGTITWNTDATCSLASCETGALAGTDWPPPSASKQGSLIRITITTPFHSALAMFWPGSRPVSFAQVTLSGGSADEVQF